jgi:Mor family transcriptional regulator
MATEKPAAEKRVYEFVDNLVRLGKAQLVERLAIEPPEAEEVMTAIAHAMILESARFHIYVPVAIELQLSPRNEAIWQEYGTPGADGARPYSTARIAQLARKHQLTERQIYKIIDVWRERTMRETQPELPGLESAE